MSGAYIPPQRRVSSKRKTEKRHVQSATRKAERRASSRNSLFTPMSSEKNGHVPPIFPDTIRIEHQDITPVPLTFWTTPSWLLKIYQEPNRTLGKDYYVIQREYAKRSVRRDAIRYQLKVVVLAKQNRKYLSAMSRYGEITTAIGSISSDHYHNTMLRTRISALGMEETGISLRIATSALGELREELRVRPEEVAHLSISPMTVMTKTPRNNRYVIYFFVDVDLLPSLDIQTLRLRKEKDFADPELPDTWRETGELQWASSFREFGKRTKKLMAFRTAAEETLHMRHR
jgi:hypothetical protein